MQSQHREDERKRLPKQLWRKLAIQVSIYVIKYCSAKAGGTMSSNGEVIDLSRKIHRTAGDENSPSVA